MIKKYHQWAPFVLRIVVGYGSMVHGWAKLGRGPSGFEKLLIQIGVPFAHLTSWIVPIIELLGGAAIFAGIFISIAAIPLIFSMVVAMVTIHYKYGFSSIKTIGLNANGPVFGPPGYEVNLLYIATLISLMLTGGGMYSIEGWIRRRKAVNGFYLLIILVCQQMIVF